MRRKRRESWRRWRRPTRHVCERRSNGKRKESGRLPRLQKVRRRMERN
jgi:hypothetical protein